MEPINRAQFKDYIFRRLGYPVIQINVDDEQAQDRIDDALAFYGDYYPLGSERSLYIHTITAEDVASNSITLPEEITSVSNILPANTSSNGMGFMSDRYQLIRNEFNSFIGGVSASIIPYYVAMTRLSDLEFLFNIQPSIRFNKHKSKVEFTGDVSNILIEGNKMVFEAQAFIDPDTYAGVWKDRWLKKYATALMKRQWAENLKLFSGVQMLGGLTLDAQTMFQEALEEINTMEEKLITTGQLSALDQIA